MVCVPMVAQTFIHSPSQTLGHALCQSVRNVQSPNIILCHMGWAFNLRVYIHIGICMIVCLKYYIYAFILYTVLQYFNQKNYLLSLHFCICL